MQKKKTTNLFSKYQETLNSDSLFCVLNEEEKMLNKIGLCSWMSFSKNFMQFYKEPTMNKQLLMKLHMGSAGDTKVLYVHGSSQPS